jgi:hypothetical protein
MGILWTILIVVVAGLIAKFLHPGPNEPSGFVVTTLLGIAGAFVATYPGARHRVVPAWPRRRTDRRNRRRDHRSGGVGARRDPRRV